MRSINIARRNINNFRYADDTTLVAESKGKLRNHLVKVKEESEKVGLKLNIQKTKIMASGPISSVQLLSRVQLCDPMNRSTPGLPVHHQLPEFTKHTSIESVMLTSHFILSSPSPPAPNPSSIRVFSNESTLRIRWPKYWSFSFSISPSNEHPGLISFRRDWLDLCSPRDSQDSSPKPQFKSINPLALFIV